MSSPSTSFRYSATRPRFSTNPSSQNRSASKEPTVMTHSTNGLPTTTEESGPGWTGGQYPGPPLPARNGNGNGSGGTGVLTDTSLSNSESSGQNGSGNNSNAAQNGHATTTTTGISTVPFPAPEEITPVEPTIIRSGKKDRRPLPPRPHPPVVSSPHPPVHSRNHLTHASYRCVFSWNKSQHGNQTSKPISLPTSPSIPVKPHTPRWVILLRCSVRPS